MKAFLSVAAVLTGLLGLAWVLLPESMLGVWSAAGAGVAAYMGRRYGGLFFGYSVMLWLSRGSGPSAARNAILAGAAVVAIVMAVVSVRRWCFEASGCLLHHCENHKKDSPEDLEKMTKDAHNTKKEYSHRLVDLPSRLGQSKDGQSECKDPEMRLHKALEELNLQLSIRTEELQKAEQELEQERRKRKQLQQALKSLGSTIYKQFCSGFH